MGLKYIRRGFVGRTENQLTLVSNFPNIIYFDHVTIAHSMEKLRVTPRASYMSFEVIAVLN